MNNTYYNIPVDWYSMDTINSYDNIINDKSGNLLSPKDGFLKGNMFNNLYSKYKNYPINDLNIQNKREELLYNYMMYNFTLTDLGLYLDNYPNDVNVINLYNNYLNEYYKILNEYERNYGPLTIDSHYLNTSPWTWDNSPWPWEVTK